MSLFHFLVGVAAEKLNLRERLEPLHDQIARQVTQRAQEPAENAVTQSSGPLPEAVLLLAHGTPDTLGEMDAYLKLVTGGRGVPPHVVHELQERYAEIGLRDEPTPEGPHLTRWTLLQGRLLAAKLGVPVYVGMRNWKPFIADVVAQMKSDGVRSARTLCLAPQNSRTSVGLYRRAVETAAGDDLQIDFLAGWAEHPLLARAFAEKMRAALLSARATGARTAVLFTAHSVPCRTVQASVKPVEHHGMVLATEPDTYNSECKKTAARIAAELSDILPESEWYFCFQSQGISGGPWIGPSVEDTLSALKQEGYEHVVLQPVGFLCDHVEILYDIDIAFQQTARELGITISRAESLNDSSTLIQALEDLVRNGYEHPLAPAPHTSAELLTVLAPLEEPATAA
ncbi:ferrochelatase [Terriglobus aquaticus]|uniref:Ferrochelatase n=1 Tax=Terriglobus aquaticus TaxID=940139 RepID=A0ABW9KFX1_9BACT|nr:ferrochelatase [Terriglobus aquaticus]